MLSTSAARNPNEEWIFMNKLLHLQLLWTLNTLVIIEFQATVWQFSNSVSSINLCLSYSGLPTYAFNQRRPQFKWGMNICEQTSSLVAALYDKYFVIIEFQATEWQFILWPLSIFICLLYQLPTYAFDQRISRNECLWQTSSLAVAL